MSRLLCCFNWKVYAGLGAVALGVLVLAPGLFWGVLPILIVAACPISMLLMSRGMQASQCATEPRPEATRATLAAQSTLTYDEQITELRKRLAGVQAQRDAIAGEIAGLDAASSPVVREAEAVARAAVERAERPA